MKIKTTAAALALVLTCAGVAHADDKTPAWGSFTGTIGGVTDYRFRGISQNMERPAIQGSIDWTHPSGFYAGAWGSNVNFGPAAKASLETDVYGGYKFAVAGISFDTGIIGYLYPGSASASHLEYWEGKIAGSYDFGVAAVNAGFNYSPDFGGDSGDAEYYSAGVTVPVMKTGVSVVGTYGYQAIDKNVKFGFPNYSSWSAGLSYSWNNFTFTGTYVDTNINNTACPDNCDATFIVGVSRTF